MSDLVERLRMWSISANAVPASDLMEEAARALRGLDGEAARLRKQRDFWIRQAMAFSEHADNMRLALLEPCGAMLREHSGE